MNSNVDVLAVMDRGLHFSKHGKAIDSDSLREARAAVAELIEAAQAMRLEASRLRGDCIPADTLADFDAALTRVTGA